MLSQPGRVAAVILDAVANAGRRPVTASRTR
jgi:hypothetical protein